MTHPSAEQARRTGAAELARALRESRRDTLQTFAIYEAALRGAGLAVPYRSTLNPPLWELGHIGWFQAYWTTRNPQWRLGVRADPDVPRAEPLRAGADALYNSSRVAHASRWSLPLPGAVDTRLDLERQLEACLARLASLGAEADDDELYFFRLALFHEDMHHEAALYMARELGIEHPDPRWQPGRLTGERVSLRLSAATVRLGETEGGFGFDNELPVHEVDVAACTIDRRVVSWREFLPFVDDDGYRRAELWSAAGWSWVQQQRPMAPAAARREDGEWLGRAGPGWRPLDLDAAACHLNHHEAEAWARWAGRRLPTEAEWELAARTLGDAFAWGEVWEWTSSPFAPRPGFEPHPYRDYSAPWFDGRPVLRGASHLTQPRMRHRCYRNYFFAWRQDIAAGLRTCAVGA